MVIETLNIRDRQSLLRHLIGRVFHLTPRASYEQILREGEITNNQSGRFPINTSSQKSYGRLAGYVCLFDLRNDTPEMIQNSLDCYYFLGPPWFSKHSRKYVSWDLVYLFLDPYYYDQLIPGSQVDEHYRETGEYLQAIPKSEVWVENRVPLDWVEKALLVKIKEPAPEKSTPAGRHYSAVVKAWDKR